MSAPRLAELPSTIQPEEKLGREERSGSSARKALGKRARILAGHARVSVFMPPRDSNEISANRMGFAPDAVMADIAIQNATALEKSFWGWYLLSGDEIETSGCIVKASPFAENPYHADIVMPVALDAEDRRDALTEYAKDLADRAVFRPWGDWADGIE